MFLLIVGCEETNKSTNMNDDMDLKCEYNWHCIAKVCVPGYYGGPVPKYIDCINDLEFQYGLKDTIRLFYMAETSQEMVIADSVNNQCLTETDSLSLTGIWMCECSIELYNEYCPN